MPTGTPGECLYTILLSERSLACQSQIQQLEGMRTRGQQAQQQESSSAVAAREQHTQQQACCSARAAEGAKRGQSQTMHSSLVSIVLTGRILNALVSELQNTMLVV